MQIVLYAGSIAAPIMVIGHQFVGDIRKRDYARVAGIASLLILLICAVGLYRGYEENQLKTAGSTTIPESSSADAQPAVTLDRAVVSFNYDPDVSYGSAPPFDSAGNPAYAFVWETIDRLGLGSTSNPLRELITPGDTVLIKPNLVSSGPGVFTRPEVVRPLVDMAIAAGATEIYIGDGTAKRVSETDSIVDSAKYSDMASILSGRYPGITIQIVDLNVLSNGWHWTSLGSNSSFAGSGYSDYDLNSLSGTLYEDEYYQTPDPQGVNPGGHALGWYAVNDKVLDADVIINVPKMKTHNLMINTLAMKNLVGLTLRNTYDEEASDCMPRIAHCITGSTGNDFYFNNDIFWRAVSDMNKVVLYADKQGNLQTTQQRKYLNVVDGIQAMEKSENYGYGGDGLPYDRHVVLASVDPVAVDAVASRVMGYDFNYVPVIGNAASDILHPIGINNPGKIVILGEEVDSRLSHVFVFNDNWKSYAGLLAVTDFEPPTINSVSREGNTATANISGGSTAYIIYQMDGTDSILEMDKDLDTYSAVLPSTVSQCLIRAQDEYFNTASTTTSSIALPSPTTTTVSSSSNPSVFGQSVTFTATVSPSAATGTVQFSIDGAAFGSPVALSGGNATSSATSSISVGSHTISAAYGGDSDYSSSTGALPGGQTVNEILPSNIVFDSFTCSPPNPVALGGTYTLTATLRNTGGTSGSATVTFGWISETTHRSLSTRTVTAEADSTVEVFYTPSPTSGAGTYTMYCTVGTSEKTVTLVVGSLVPTISTVNPDSGDQGQTLVVAITGTGLTDATAVTLGSGVTTNSFSVISDTEIAASISIGGNATTGGRDVLVTTPNGVAAKTGGFTVASELAPTVSSVSPARGSRAKTITVTVAGTNFDGATAVSFGSGITVGDFSANSGTQITAEITIDADATIGPRDVSVTTGWGTGTKPDGFKVANKGSICSGGGLAAPARPSEMTTVLAALGLLFGVGYLLTRKGSKSNVRAQ